MADQNEIPLHLYEPFKQHIDKELASVIYQSTHCNEETTFSTLLEMVAEATASSPRASTYAAAAATNVPQAQADAAAPRERQIVSHDDDSGCDSDSGNGGWQSQSKRSGCQPAKTTTAKPRRVPTGRAKVAAKTPGVNAGWTASAALPANVQLAISLWPVPSEDVFAVWGASGGDSDAAHHRLQDAYPEPYQRAQERMLTAYTRVSDTTLGGPLETRDTYLHLAERVRPLIRDYRKSSAELHKASIAVVARRHGEAEKKGGHRVAHGHTHTPPQPAGGGGSAQKQHSSGRARGRGGRSGRRGGRLQMASGSFAAAPQPTGAADQPSGGGGGKAVSLATLTRAVMTRQSELATALEALCADSQVLCLLMLESVAEKSMPGVCCLQHIPVPDKSVGHDAALVQQATQEPPLDESQGGGTPPSSDDSAAAALAAAAKWDTAEQAASVAASAGLGVAEVRRGKVKVQLPAGRARAQVQYDSFGNPLVRRKGGRGGHATAPSPFGRSGGPVKEGDYDHEAMQAAFQEERSQGLEARRQRERVIQRAVAAKSAHGRFSGAVAGYFWEKAAVLQEKAQSADAYESVALLQRVNKHLGPTSNGVKLHEGCTVDLHGQLRRDAEQMLNHVLIPSILANGIRTIQFVVGEGRHSAASGETHPLADTVKAVLRAAVRDGRVQRFQRNGATFSVWA